LGTGRRGHQRPKRGYGASLIARQVIINPRRRTVEPTSSGPWSKTRPTRGRRFDHTVATRAVVQGRILPFPDGKAPTRLGRRIPPPVRDSTPSSQRGREDSNPRLLVLETSVFAVFLASTSQIGPLRESQWESQPKLSLYPMRPDRLRRTGSYWPRRTTSRTRFPLRKATTITALWVRLPTRRNLNFVPLQYRLSLPRMELPAPRLSLAST